MYFRTQSKFKRIPIQNQLRHETQGWWEGRRVTQAFNKHFDSGTEQQIGGVSIVAANTMAHRSTTQTMIPLA